MELKTEKISGISLRKDDDGLVAIIIGTDHYSLEKMGIGQIEELYEVNRAKYANQK